MQLNPFDWLISIDCSSTYNYFHKKKIVIIIILSARFINIFLINFLSIFFLLISSKHFSTLSKGKDYDLRKAVKKIDFAQLLDHFVQIQKTHAKITAAAKNRLTSKVSMAHPWYLLVKVVNSIFYSCFIFQCFDHDHDHLSQIPTYIFHYLYFLFLLYNVNSLLLL